MPVQTPQWTDVLCCCICFNVFDGVKHQPISLICGHTACRACLLKLKTKQCPFDQTSINIAVADLLQNCSILKILGVTPPNEDDKIRKLLQQQDAGCKFKEGSELLEVLAVYVKRVASEKGGSVWSPQLSRPMQRKLVTLLCCNLIEPEGRNRVMKAVRSLAERSLTELLLMHQNPYHLSSNLWATVRARGCQFLGPAMQEEVLKLVLLALSEGALISRKVLVMYIVQTLEKEYPQASKTSVGHVVQLLYRASCFNVIKRDGESSLMQLKEDFRTYDSLRREHDAQIVQIAMEAGLRISPDQWSALLYGDQTHKSHMQSIIDRLQTPQSFYQCIQELLIGLQRTGDPGHLVELRPHFELLADIDPSQGENTNPSWHKVVEALRSVKTVVDGQVKFCETYGNNRNQRENVERNVVAYKFKTSMCRDITDGKSCPRGDACTFAHCLEEMERYRARSRLMGYRSTNGRQSGDGLGDDGPASLFEGEEPPEAERKDLTQWNCQLNVVDVEQQQRKPYVMSPATFQQTLLTPTMVPPPTLAMPPPMKTVQQLIATDMSVAAPMLTATPPPQMNPQLAAVLAQPAPMLAQPPPANMAFSSNPFALNVMPQIPQYGTVRYQIIRPTNQPPTQVTSQLAAPISVTGTSDFGYYWYPPCGAGGFQSRVSGEVLHLEVPLARVIPGPSHLIQNLPTEYFTAPQQAFAPPQMEYYMYPPTGIPIRLDESGYVHTQQVHRPITVLSTGTLHSVNQTKPVIEDVTHICHDNKHCVEKTSSDEKKGRLVLLEKKRQEILIRLDALRINGQKVKRVENFNNNESCHSQRQQIVTSVMRDSSSSQSSIVASSLGNNGYSKGIYCSSQGDKSISNDSDCAFSNGSSAWSSVSSSPNSLVSKESLVPTSSVPLISKCCSKKVQRSLSSEVNGKGDQSNLYSPWNNTRSPYEVSKTAGNAWRQDDSDGIAPSDSKKSNNVSGTHSSSGYIYATRPYIPEDYIDIKHLSDDVLKKQLQQLPQTSKRLYYIRYLISSLQRRTCSFNAGRPFLELESRESYCWRSDDDLVIPFSGDPHVSRYGPISRSRVALTVNSVVATPSSSTTVASELVHVKDTIQQPLPTAVVQQAKDQYITSSTGDSTSVDVSSIPIVFQASAGSMGASTVGEKLDKVLEMKEKLENLPMSEGASSVEREQLKMDLEIINKEIATLDKETEVECLLKELKSVNLNIEALQQD